MSAAFASRSEPVSARSILFSQPPTPVIATLVVAGGADPGETGAVMCQDLTAGDMNAVVWMALAIVHKTGRDTAVNRRYLTLLFDGLRPTGQRLPAARSESQSGSANREPRRSHKRPCSVGRPDTPRP